MTAATPTTEARLMSDETTVRYTTEQMSAMAKALHYSGTDEFSDEAASMLDQAVSDINSLVDSLKSAVPHMSIKRHVDVLARQDAREALARFQS